MMASILLNKFLLKCAVVCAIALSVISGGVAQSSSGQERNPQKAKAVAVVNGLVVTEEQVEKAAAADLERLTLQQEQLQAEFQRNKHQALETALNRLIEEKLLDAEVSRVGTSREKLLASEVESKVKEPSDDEISAFYEANKGQIGRPKEQVAGLIREYIKENRRKQVRSSFLEQLKQKYPVKSFFEPLRIPVESAGHPSRGSAQAPVTIVEFSDFECPYCTRLTTTLKEVEKNYGGKLRLVFRQFPLPIHPQAEKAAEASLCAAEQGSFWEMHNLLFETPQRLSLEDLKAGATKLGLDKTSFSACLDSGKYADRVKRDIRDGTRAGVSGTPAMFINGRFISGAVPYEDIAKVINDELAAASARQ